MKIYTYFNRAVGVVAVVSFFVASVAHATMVPNMSLYAVTTGSSDVQITVFGADPNVSVLLYYPSSASLTSQNIGSTNSSGYLTTTVDANTYGIASGASVYVMVDGQASQSSLWPSYTGSGTLPLSQTNVTLSTGQSLTISASVSAPLTLSTNTNPSVATASISGSQINITGFNKGTTNITVCASGLGCATISVNVQSSSASAANISFSPSTATVAVGQSQTVGINGSGNYYLSLNSAPGFVSASLNGSSLTIGGTNPGSSVITVCSTATNSTICGAINVLVTQSSNSVVSTTQAALTFGQSNVTLNVGQTQAVAIYGGTGGLYVSSNSAPNSVGANVSGTNVNLTGVAFGGDNITICSVNGQCGILYAYVSSGATSATSINTTTVAPAITSFSVSSNDANNNFLGSGNALTITFSTNQSISVPSITVSGAAVSVNGSGNGPYTGTYSMTGNETLPMPVVINFSNPAGSASTARFWVGGTGAPSTVSTSNVSSGTLYTFTQYLYNGSTGAQVTALQNRLTADGVYSGPITGTFGSLTEAALKAYQKKHDINPLGVVGPATKVLLNKGI